MHVNIELKCGYISSWLLDDEFGPECMLPDWKESEEEQAEQQWQDDWDDDNLDDDFSKQLRCVPATLLSVCVYLTLDAHMLHACRAELDKAGYLAK